MFVNIAPLKKYREFRLLFGSQSINFLGSMVSYVAVPYQVYQLTQSSFYVGMLSLAQLIPMLLFSLIGGQIADTHDRRKILLYSEMVMGIGSALLMVNAFMDHPSLTLIFLCTVVMQALNGFHNPAYGALQQKVVLPEDYAAMGALNMTRGSIAQIAGPALGGILVSQCGIGSAYLFDMITYAISVGMLVFLPADVRSAAIKKWHPRMFLDNIREAVAFALKRQELLGTYFIDLAAMTFAFPIALFPEMSKEWGGANAAGILFSAMSIGALLVSILSGWSSKARRQGMWVVLAAAGWGLAIVGAGFANSLWFAVFWLILAGASDSLSAIFRIAIWNETIPNDLRGRMGSLEIISYMTGPLLGNARAGWMAAAIGWHYAIGIGGAMSFVAVVLATLCLPKFWYYRSIVKNETP